MAATVSLATQNGNAPAPLPEARANGAISCAISRIGSLALSILAGAIFFSILPWEGALVLTMTAATIFLIAGSAFCNSGSTLYVHSAPTIYPSAPVFLNPLPWHRRAVNWFPFSRREYVPVADPRPREVVGGARHHRRPIDRIPIAAAPPTRVRSSVPEPQPRDREPVGRRETSFAPTSPISLSRCDAPSFTFSPSPSRSVGLSDRVPVGRR